MNSMPPCHRVVALSTPWRRSSAAPTSASDTATVSNEATVSEKLRRRFATVSRGEVVEASAMVSRVHALALVADDRAVVELDDPAAHRVDDATGRASPSRPWYRCG